MTLNTWILNQVRELIDIVEIPTGEEDLIVLKIGKGEDKGKIIYNVNPTSQYFIGQTLSKETFPNGNFRYAKLPLQRAYNLAHSDKRFRKELKQNWIYLREAFPNKDSIMPDPILIEKDEEAKSYGDLVYEGETIPITINTNDVFDTFFRAGLLEEPHRRVYRGPINFDWRKQSNVACTWDPKDDCFAVAAVGPVSTGLRDNITVFEKTSKQYVEGEYEALKRKSQEIKEPITYKMNSKLRHLINSS